MGSPLRQPFFPSGEFVARKPFPFNGEQFNTGDDFPVEKLGVEDRKLRTMYNAGFLMRKPTKEEKAASKVEKKKETSEVKKESADDKKLAKDEARKARAAARKAKKKG